MLYYVRLNVEKYKDKIVTPLEKKDSGIIITNKLIPYHEMNFRLNSDRNEIITYYYSEYGFELILGSVE